MNLFAPRQCISGTVVEDDEPGMSPGQLYDLLLSVVSHLEWKCGMGIDCRMINDAGRDKINSSYYLDSQTWQQQGWLVVTSRSGDLATERPF